MSHRPDHRQFQRPNAGAPAPAEKPAQAAEKLRTGLPEGFVATNNPLSQGQYPVGTFYTAADITKRGHHPMLLVRRGILKIARG
jgi:glutathione S-transferase